MVRFLVDYGAMISGQTCEQIWHYAKRFYDGNLRENNKKSVFDIRTHWMRSKIKRKPWKKKKKEEKKYGKYVPTTNRLNIISHVKNVPFDIRIIIYITDNSSNNAISLFKPFTIWRANFLVHLSFSFIRSILNRTELHWTMYNVHVCNMLLIFI